MPGISGFELLKKLKKEKSLGFTSFIYITAVQERTSFRHGMTIGADDYLTKPFSREELLNAISSRLERFSTFEHFIRKNERELLEELAALKKQIDSNHAIIGKYCDQLQEKETELIKTSMHLIAINNKLQVLRILIDNELKNTTLTDAQKKMLIQLRNKTRDEALLTDNLAIFQLKFNMIYPHFISKVIRKYTNLTQYELVMLSALAMGFNTTQLAGLLNISDGSVRTSKYRLKKKFGLSRNDSLLLFIRSFHTS